MTPTLEEEGHGREELYKEYVDNRLHDYSTHIISPLIHTMHYAKLLLAAAAALPSASSLATLGVRDGKPIVETTTLPNGQVVDWVLNDEVAPPTGQEDVLSKITKPLNGPKGAVPYLRSDPDRAAFPKASPLGLAKRDATGHKYGLTEQYVSNNGGGATFSCFNPSLESNDDMSLVQTAIGRSGVNNLYWTGQSVFQSVEAGLIKYPLLTGNSGVHLFAFFNTNGYGGQGDNTASYNTQYQGWVQVDNQVFLGQEFGQSICDGTSEINIQYSLVQGNWWLSVGGRNLGYYPGSLFNKNVTSGDSLAAGAASIAFYGEVYSADASTTTQMGSGYFPSAGSQYAAHVRNMVYTSSQNVYNYNANTNNYVTDPDAYQIETYFNSGPSWGSYILVGGPGYSSS